MFSQEAAAVTHTHQRSPSEGGGGGDDGRLMKYSGDVLRPRAC